MRTLTALLILSSVAFAQTPQERAEQDRKITEFNEARSREMTEERHRIELMEKDLLLEQVKTQAIPAAAQLTPEAIPKTEGTLRFQLNGQWLEFPLEFLPKGVQPPPPPVDSDGDGTPDATDPCPNDPEDKCDDPPPPPVDTDGDGIPDAEDECPDDPTNKCNEPPPGPAVDVFSDQRARMKALLAAKHPWALYVEKHAQTWGKDSVFAEAYWLMTESQEAGQALFVQSFYPSGGATTTRYIHGLPRLPLHFWDLRRAGVLTAEQLALAERRMREYAEHMLVPGNIRLGDTDEVVYAFCFLAMADAVLGTDYMNHPVVGGWTHDSSKDVSNMRTEIYLYCTLLGKGGAGADASSMYNKQTYGSLAETHSALLKLRGKDDWPDVATFKAEAAVFEEMQIFPNYAYERSWGDNQAPWSVWNLYKSGALAAMGNHRAVNRIYNAIGATSSTNLPWRGWHFIQPTSTAGPPLPFSQYAAGQGILVARDDDTQFFTQFAPYPVGVDHYHQMTQGNWTLWHKNKSRPAIGYKVYYGVNPGGMNEMLFAGTSGFNKKPGNKTFGDGKTWSAISGGDYGFPVNEYGAYWDTPGPPEIVKERTRSQVFVEGENPFVVLRDKFTVLDARKQPDIWKVQAYHNWTYQNWHPIASPAPNQVVIDFPPKYWDFPSGYWMMWSPEAYLGNTPKISRVTAIEPWKENPNQTLVTFDNAAGSPVDTDYIGFKGGGTFSRVMAATEVARHQIHVWPGAKLAADGTCTFLADDYQVTISHHGTPAEFRLADSGDFASTEEKEAYPQRWEAFIPFNDQSEHSADWYTVIQTANPPLPVSLQGTTITVGTKSVTFGSSDAIGVQ